MNPHVDRGNPRLHAVGFGGGTGLSNLLRGLKGRLRNRSHHGVSAALSDKPMLSDITAIVAMTDDGGSSGRLRDALHIPPPGDLRNCMVALSEDNSLLSLLFQHRFSPGSALGDHSLGNICIAALSQITGDFVQAVELACEMLGVCGRILPVTAANSTLIAHMSDGSLVAGETALTRSPLAIAELGLDPPNAPALPATLDAIADADLIIVGPGSLYTSVITNLLVKGIPEAICHTQATRVYVANLMTQPNESLGLTLSQHIERIHQHARHPIFDCAIVNTGPIPKDMVRSYAVQGGQPVTADINRVEAMGIRCFTGDFVAKTGPVIRHNPEILADTLLRLPLFRPLRRTDHPIPSCRVLQGSPNP